MIVVATEDFELYHDILDELRMRELTFTTITPGESIPGSTSVILTGPEDEVTVGSDIPIISTDIDGAHEAIETAISHIRGASGHVVVGVDPGERPGIAVLRGGLVVSAFHVPFEHAVETIQAEVSDHPDAIVRIGNGARLKGAQLVNELDDIEVELVDETGTTPYLGTGARGAGDILAAVNIAHRRGDPIDTREIEPTPGELQRIQRRSRELSPTNRQIDAGLAESVAHGELTVEEALERHRER